MLSTLLWLVTASSYMMEQGCVLASLVLQFDEYPQHELVTSANDFVRNILKTAVPSELYDHILGCLYPCALLRCFFASETAPSCS